MAKKVTTEAALLWEKGNHHIRRQLLGDEIQSQMHGVEYEELLEKDWYNLHNNDMVLITANVEKLKKPINEFIEKHKDHITGKNVDIGQTEGKDKDNVFRVTDLVAEIIEFEQELYGDLGVVLWGYENQYVHESQLEEFLKGDNLPVFIKSSEKGGDIQLILKGYKNDMNLDRKGTDLESAKSFLVYDIEQELEKLKSNSEYEGSNEEVQNGLSITDRLKNDFGFDWENDDDASAYFSRASVQEIYEYMLKVIIPKLKPDKSTENKKVDDADLAIGQKVRFKDKAGKAIMNSWLDLSGQTGLVSYVLRRSDGVLKEVYIKLDKGYEILDEWDNQVIFTEIDELIELEDMIEIIKEKNMAKYADLTIKEQIKWLEDFGNRWGEVYGSKSTQDFGEEAKLQSEYDQFLMQYNLPNWSADELASSMRMLESLKGLAIVVKDEETGERYKTKIKALFFDDELSNSNTENPAVNIVVEDKPIGHFYSFQLSQVRFLQTGQNAEGVDVTFNPDVASFDEETKTAFSDAGMFLADYQNYLIGKSVKVGDQEDTMIKLPAISNVVKIDDNSIEISYEDGQTAEQDGIVPSIIFSDNFQAFIDGEITKQIINDNGKHTSGKIMLILQEEKQEEKTMSSINNQDYRYFVVNPKTNKISSGWEYKEDAEDAAKEDIEFGKKDVAVFSKKTVSNLGIDPDDDNVWYSNKDDFSIIEEAVKFGVTEGDYDEEMAKSYMTGYSNGKYLAVIKARLVYYLEHADKHFRKAVVNSDYKKAAAFAETKTRIQNELISIIKRDV